MLLRSVRIIYLTQNALRTDWKQEGQKSSNHKFKLCNEEKAIGARGRPQWCLSQKGRMAGSGHLGQVLRIPRAKFEALGTLFSFSCSLTPPVALLPHPHRLPQALISGYEFQT